MSLERHIPEPPGWEELKKAMAPDAPPELREDVKARLKLTTPADEAVLGARDFLEDSNYNFDALRSFVFPMDQPVHRTSETKRLIPAIVYRASAAAVLTAAMLYGGWSLRTDYRHRQVTDRIFYEPGLPVFAGLGGERIFHEMMTSFRLQESAEGLRYIDTLEQLYGRNDTLSYYAGWLHYYDKNYAGAAQRFDEVGKDSASIYFEKSELMTAAALYLEGRLEEARSRLEEIMRNHGHGYRNEAEGLLNSNGR